ncbi:hypothetical protein Plhal703r1_c35g0128841 [Plasmopara halstedii]
MEEVEKKAVENVKLRCGVYGEGSVFSVEIQRDADVEALQKAIVNEKKDVNLRFNVDPALVTLYLAKEKKKGKKRKWLEDDDNVKGFLRGQITKKYKKMRPSWKLNKEEYFGDFQLGEEEIHILVEFPTQKVAAPSGVIPPLPPTTLHRHPERLRRWAAINAMIRQKNQDANQKTTTKDAKNTNKKRENHDIDKSVGYSTLCWEDIKPIYNFDYSYELQPSDIPDADIELLLARIRDLRELYGRISDGNEAKRLFFIAPILETVSLKDWQYVLLKGRFEFVLKRGTKRISIVQAKREDMLQGVVQNVTGLEALADVEDLTVTYGIVTNFLEWKFLISGDEKVREHETVLHQANTIPSFEGLKDIVGKIYRMLSNEQ